MKNFKTPILLIIFNRPDKVKAIMDVLSKIQPSYLYIAADGPRENIKGEKEKCTQARRLTENTPWACERHTHYLDKNNGVDKAIEIAISWFFSEVEEGIILEDDCMPNEDFFQFTQTLLNKYRDDKKIMVICGTNFQDGTKHGEASYYFSKYHLNWGWASWRRAWSHFDSKLEKLDDFIDNKKIETTLKDEVQRRYWLGFFKKIRSGKFSFVDSKWQFSIWNAGGICIVPNANLVKNIGNGPDATHTKMSTDLTAPSEELGPLSHPSNIKIDDNADDYFFYKVHHKTFLKKLRDKILIMINAYF